MKRYQCIKDVEMLSLVGISGSNGQIAFRQGKIYQSNDKHLKDDYNNTWSVSHPVIADGFHELLDLNVDDEDQIKYVAVQPSHGCSLTALSLCIAAIATTGLIIYLALTWRS